MKRPWKSPPQWLLEGVFIVVSVLLGFAVAQFGDYRKDRHLAAQALDSLRAEIEHNIALLEPLVSVHERWVEALATPAPPRVPQAAIDVWFATRPPLPGSAKATFPFLRRSAWDAAVSGGALRLIDYHVTAALSDIYRLQGIATENVDRLANGPLSSPATYDPAARVAAVRMLWLTLADIQSAEAMLLELYRQHLPTISNAARDAR